MSFDKITKQIMEDERNKVYTDRGVKPLYSASKEAKIAIIGQAPGKKAEESRLFWNDPSGDRLREWMGVSREEFYSIDKIAHLPMDFYFPGKAKTGDKAPRKHFAETWHSMILEAMPNIETIVLIGNYSQKHYLGKDRKRNLTETVRHYKEYLPDYFPLVHPSPLNFRWHSQNPWFEEEVVPEFREFIQEVLSN